MQLELDWHLHVDRSFDFVRCDDTLAVAFGVNGELIAFRPNGELAWTADTGGGRAMVLGKSMVVTLGGGMGGRWTLTGRERTTGEVRWAKSVPAGRMSRLFADDQGTIYGTMSRDRNFVLERYREIDGESAGTTPLDRQRGMVARDGARVWTRDDDGITEHDLSRGTSKSVDLPGGGAMTEEGPWLISTGDDEIVAIRDGSIVWRRQVQERDLSVIATADGVDDDDDDVWEPELGRAVIEGARVYVADLNGTLHALQLETGEPLWSAYGAHYPSSQSPAMPAVFGGAVVFPCSDENLYLLDDAGVIQSACELPFPFEGRAITFGDNVLLPCDGVRAFRIV